MHRRITLALAVVLLMASSVVAQIAETEADPFRNYGETVTARYRVGLSINAAKGPVQNVFAMVAVPFECDEQEVIVADEDISNEIESVKYRVLQNGVRQMLITIPELPGNTEAHAIMTFEVRTKTIVPPDDELTAQLVKPKKLDREMKRYLGKSKYIQHNNSKIRRTLRDIFAEKSEQKEKDTETESVENAIKLTSATVASDEPKSEQSDSATDDANAEAKQLNSWQRVEKIYDFVQHHVKYVEGEDQTALQTLESGKGDCHDVSALFVALCRADKVPARMVWVHEHQYPEFCLQDAAGKLHWFPCESSGTRAFGEMPLAHVIMQKGDNFRFPERPGESFRYASEFLIGSPIGNSGKPTVRYIRELL